MFIALVGLAVLAPEATPSTYHVEGYGTTWDDDEPAPMATITSARTCPCRFCHEPVPDYMPEDVCGKCR